MFPARKKYKKGEMKIQDTIFCFFFYCLKDTDDNNPVLLKVPSLYLLLLLESDCFSFSTQTKKVLPTDHYFFLKDDNSK